MLPLPLMFCYMPRLVSCISRQYQPAGLLADIQQELVTQFETRDDLIAALLTSCHIPIYFTGSFARQFRGKLACDGGLSNFLPTPSVAQYAVRVCCFPSQSLSQSLSLVRYCFYRTAATRFRSLMHHIIQSHHLGRVNLLDASWVG